jgi:hypothetical protein
MRAGAAVVAVTTTQQKAPTRERRGLETGSPTQQGRTLLACSPRYLQKLREAALREVFAQKSFAGVAELAAGARRTMTVGATLAGLSLNQTALVDWIVAEAGDLLPTDPLTATFNGLLLWMPPEASIALLRAVVERTQKAEWPPEKLARLLALAPGRRATWDLAEARGPEVEEAYWRHSNPGFWLRSETEDFRFALQRLLRAGRPRTALQLCHLDLKEISPALLMDMMEAMLRGEEPDGALHSSWDIANVVDTLEANRAVDRERLARLEFGLLRLLGYGGERKAKTLYGAVMTQPKLFAELVALAYKPRHAERTDTPTDQERNIAQTAWSLLRNCPALPGQDLGAPIEATAVAKFVAEARELRSGPARGLRHHARRHSRARASRRSWRVAPRGGAGDPGPAGARRHPPRPLNRVDQQARSDVAGL